MRDLAIAPEAEDGRARVLCARCYSLSHYGCAHLQHLVPRLAQWVQSGSFLHRGMLQGHNVLRRSPALVHAGAVLCL